MGNIKKYTDFISENQYAGQRKVSRDIDRKLKNEKSSEKSNDKKNRINKTHYYAKLLNKNKVNSELDEFYKNIPTKALDELVEYWSNMKMMWNKKEVNLSKDDISKLKEVQFYVNKYYPEYNSKFSKKEH